MTLAILICLNCSFGKSLVKNIKSLVNMFLLYNERRKNSQHIVTSRDAQETKIVCFRN